MKLKKTLSMFLAVVMVASAVGFAAAETAEPAATAEPEAADAATAYTLEKMLNMAMADAYIRQAAFAAYAETFPDSRSLANVNLDTQIVLLEMLLKANGAALSQNTAETAVPQTVAEAYQAALTAETNAAEMYRSFLADESLPADARIIFRSVLQSVRESASVFARQVRIAQREAAWEEMLAGGNAKVYTMQGPGGRGSLTVYVYTNTTDDTAAADEPADTDAAADDTTVTPEATPGT